MATQILMPALSPTMTEGKLARWLKNVGDDVRAGDVIAEIETDKATMEVEAVDEGVVEELLVPEGTEEVKVNTPIARLSGGDSSSRAPAPSEPAPANAVAKAEGPVAAPAVVVKTSPPSAEANAAPARRDGARIFASPLARRIAKDAGVDLAQVKGSGPHGRIIQRDVDGLTGGQPAAASAARAPATRAPISSATRPVQSLEDRGIPAGSYDLVPDCSRSIIRRSACIPIKVGKRAGGQRLLTPLVRSSECLHPACVFYVPRGPGGALGKQRRCGPARASGGGRALRYGRAARARRPNPSALP